MVARVDGEDEVVRAGADVGGGQEDRPAEIVNVGIEEGESFELGCVGLLAGVGGRWGRVEGVVDVADLRGRGAWELGGEEGVKGGLCVAGWGDEQAGLLGNEGH